MPESTEKGSGDDVREELVLKRRNAVLQNELSLLQTLNLQIVGMCLGLHRLDGGIEIAVLEPELGQLISHSSISDLDHPAFVAHRGACLLGTGRTVARAGDPAKSHRRLYVTVGNSPKRFDTNRRLCHPSFIPAEMEARMPVDLHLAELERRHQALKQEIQEAISHPGFDELEVATLKRRKLRLKDEIAKLMKQETMH
jgi:hypothetical protein